MKFNGREVNMVRRVVVGDPYYDERYEKYVVDYADGTGREYVKRSQLEDFVAPPEDKFDRSVTEHDEPANVTTMQEVLRQKQIDEQEKKRKADEAKAKKSDKK